MRSLDHIKTSTGIWILIAAAAFFCLMYAWYRPSYHVVMKSQNPVLVLWDTVCAIGRRIEAYHHKQGQYPQDLTVLRGKHMLLVREGLYIYTDVEENYVVRYQQNILGQAWILIGMRQADVDSLSESSFPDVFHPEVQRLLGRGGVSKTGKINMQYVAVVVPDDLRYVSNESNPSTETVQIRIP